MSEAANLSQKRCLPCEGMTKPLAKNEVEVHLKNLPSWKVQEDGRGIFREYKIKNFMTAVKFINQIAEIAEAENHHPDLHLTGYRNLRIDLSTHAIGGLSENDFIVAAKIDQIPVELKK